MLLPIDYDTLPHWRKDVLSTLLCSFPVYITPTLGISFLQQLLLGSCSQHLSAEAWGKPCCPNQMLHKGQTTELSTHLLLCPPWKPGTGQPFIITCVITWRSSSKGRTWRLCNWCKALLCYKLLSLQAPPVKLTGCVLLIWTVLEQGPFCFSRDAVSSWILRTGSRIFSVLTTQVTNLASFPPWQWGSRRQELNPGAPKDGYSSAGHSGHQQQGHGQILLNEEHQFPHLSSWEPVYLHATTESGPGWIPGGNRIKTVQKPPSVSFAHCSR